MRKSRVKKKSAFAIGFSYRVRKLLNIRHLRGDKNSPVGRYNQVMRGKKAKIVPILALLGPSFLTAQNTALPPRISEEADVLAQNAARIVTRETLVQRSVMPPLRFKPRAGSPTDLAMGPRFRIREVVSEFSFGPLRSSGSPTFIEYRQATSVDGQPTQAADVALRALAAGIQAGDERTRKRMLEQFARNGLVDIATDYALILLAFTAHAQEQMEFTPATAGYVGTDAALSFSWKQKSGREGVLEFRGTQATYRPLQGALWVRASDGLPLRVTAWSEYTDAARKHVRDDASVDYILSTHGFVTPASVLHRHLIDGIVITENLYRYEPFKLFTADSSIKFGDIPDAVKK